MPNDKRPAEPKRAPLSAPQRFLLSALAVVSVVLLCMGANALMPRPDAPASADALTSAAPGTDGAEETSAPDTPSPAPGLTPTPAVYAPFGAQYGFGGDELLPETPVPSPTDTPAPEPTDTPAPTDAPEPTKEAFSTLRRGATGEAVRRMQAALIELGYLEGEADGDFGGGTARAVVAFQAVNGLSADGIAGPKTLETLYGGEALSAAEAPPPDFLILVNRDNALEKDYLPPDLVEIADVVPGDVLKVKYKGTRANRTACEALCKMLQDAIDEGVGNWQVSSAYRTYAGQQELVEESVAGFKERNPDWSRQKCLSATYQTVAPAGTSEHQTGLAFDITVPGVSFTGTEQQKWLHEHCYEYGFVVRFTKEKEKITGFLAESWHIRYVGAQAAAVMTYNDWCLEEYVEKM